jgi:hypothetical protein
MTSLRDKMPFRTALLLVSVLIPWTQGCSLPPETEAWLEEGSGSRQSSVAVRADSVLGDQEMEQFLLNARVITAIPTPIPATTLPMPLDVEWNGEIRKAIFKYMHTGRPDSVHLEMEGAGPTSPDSYRHEVAAYRLDRVLGLKMVPVAVIRMLRMEGALIEWVSEGFTEQQLRARGDYPSAAQRVAQQRAVMQLFDALVLNLYRRRSDQLITPGNWKLHLIDHSRAFGTSMKLPESFAVRRGSLPGSLLTKLQNLEEASLKSLLDGLLNDAQIVAILRRRDKILKRIEVDQTHHSDDTVSQD